jgi:hypothetical protein
MTGPFGMSASTIMHRPASRVYPVFASWTRQSGHYTTGSVFR